MGLSKLSFSFVFKKAQWSNAKKTTIDNLVETRANSLPICSRCGQVGPRHGRQSVRRFTYFPVWEIPVTLVYAPRRVMFLLRHPSEKPSLDASGEPQESSDGDLRLISGPVGSKTLLVGDGRGVPDDIEYRLPSRVHGRPMGIGPSRPVRDPIDRKRRDRSSKGHSYITRLYQIDRHCKHLLWIGMEHTIGPLQEFFNRFGPDKSSRLRFVASDMWASYVKVITEPTPHALHILDRFHIMAHRGKAIDEIRSEEVRSLRAQGQQPLLSQAKWVFPQETREPHSQEGDSSGGTVAPQSEGGPGLPPQRRPKRIPSILPKCLFFSK